MMCHSSALIGALLKISTGRMRARRTFRRGAIRW